MRRTWRTALWELRHASKKYISGWHGIFWSWTIVSMTSCCSIGSTQQLKKFPLESVPIGTASINQGAYNNSLITSSGNVRKVGVVQASNTIMTLHVSKICSSACLHLGDIGRIHPFLSQDTDGMLCERLRDTYNNNNNNNNNTNTSNGNDNRFIE